jgi:hypothetical protein
MYNMPLLHRQMLEVLGIKNANKLIPMDEDQKPTDPVTENQNVLMGKPVKAFMYQDHQAHIMVHMSAMQDPKIQQLLQNNPIAPQLQAAMMNHINEHLGFEYRKQIEMQLGMDLPPQKDESGEDVNMDPAVEAKLAPMLAQAAQRLTQANQAQAQQQQAQQQMQDPLIQMQQQELAIKQAEQQRKVAKDQADVQLRMQQQKIEAARIMAQKDTTLKQAMLKAKVDLFKDKVEQQHDRAIQSRDIMADAVKTVFQHKMEKYKPTKGE